MIDPRMIRPEAVPPSTDVVTPSPQYYGQGQVVGGQIQLGDVYGRLPSQSQEEYMYGNLANIANAAMGLAQIPGQLEQAQRRREQRHDQDAINAYQVELNKIEQASLNGESFYNYSNNEYPINTPEGKSQLELDIQERMLGNLITSGGKAEASRLKTAILAQRNQDIDARIQELFVEYKSNFNKFKAENILLNPVALNEAYKSNPTLNTLKEQLQSYRNTDSTVFENVAASLNEEDFTFSADAHAFMVTEATREITESFSVLSESLPSFLSASQNPNLPLATQFIDWVGEIDSPEKLHNLVGITPEGEVVPGMLLDTVTTSPTASNIKELMTVILNHQLQGVTVFSPEERDTFIRNVVNGSSNKIAKVAADHYTTITQRNLQSELLARQMLYSDLVSDAGNNKYTVYSGAFEGIPENVFQETINNDLSNNNLGNNPLKFVTLAAQSYTVDNFGMPGGPISAHTIRQASFILGVDEEDLFKQGYYQKEDDGKVYLTDKGIKFQQRKTRELINKLVKTNGYSSLVSTAVGNIRSNINVQGAPNLDTASIAINGGVVDVIRKYFPLDSFITDDDILKTFGLVTDKEQEPSQALLAIMGPNYTRAIKQEVLAVLDAWKKSTETTSASSGGSTANSWITNKNPLDNPKLQAEALDYLQRVSANPDSIDKEWERLMTFGGHNQASLAKLHQAAVGLERRTLTGNISNKNLGRYGLLDESINISTEELATFDVSEVKDPRNFFVNPKYFDKNTLKFTKEGAIAWAAYTNQLLYAPLSNENSTNIIKDFIEGVSALEETAEPELQGVPLMMLAAFMQTAQQSSVPGIQQRHTQGKLFGVKEIMMPDGSLTSLDIDPTIDSARDAYAIYMSVDEKSASLAIRLALIIGSQIASLPDELTDSSEKIRQFIQEKAREYSGLLSVSRSDVATFGQQSSPVLRSGQLEPDLRIDTPNQLTEEIRIFTSDQTQNRKKMWEYWTGPLNFFRDPSNQITVTNENVDMTAAQITRGAIDYLRRTNSNMQFQVPSLLADVWNADSLNDSDVIREGTRLRLWSSNPNEITIQTLLENAETSGNLDGLHELPELREIMDHYRVGLATSSPGNPNNLSQTIGIMAYLYNRNSIQPSLGDNLFKNAISFNDYALLMIPDPVPNNRQVRYRDFRGNTQSGVMRSITIPEGYNNLNMSAGSLMDNNGHPMFANVAHRLASEYLESTPNTSNNPEAYAKARLSWLIETIPGFKEVWSSLSEERKSIITRLSSDEDTTLLSFIRGSIWVASKENADVADINNYPTFTFNGGGLEKSEFIRRVNDGGWVLIDNNRSSYGFELDSNGHYIIKNNTSGTNITLDPKIIQFVDPIKVTDSIAGPPPISYKRYELTPGEYRALQNQKNREAREKHERFRQQNAQDGENTPLNPDLEKTIRELETEFKINNQDSGFFDGEKTIPLSSNTASGGSFGTLGSAAAMLSQMAVTAPPLTDVAKLIIGEEGFISGPRKATRTEQHLTVGHGHKLDGSKRSRAAFKKALPNKNYDEFMKGKGSITKEEALRLFEADMPDYIKRAESFTNYEYIYNKKTKQRPRGGRLGGLTFSDHSNELQKYIISATFRGSWGDSPKARKLLSEGRYEEAAKEFLNNDGYRNAVANGRRGIRKRMEDVAKAIRDEAKRKRS